LLQGNARTHTNLPPLPPPRLKQQPKSSPSRRLLQKPKQFRFALIAGGQQVRTVVHEIQSHKRMRHLWWSDEEMLAIRRQAIDVVKHFRKCKPQFSVAVERVATCSDTTVVEDSMKQLTRDSYARGLETHIVSFLAQARSDTVAAVLEEQKECRLCQDSYDLTAEALRGQSLAYSTTARTFALKMAGCDQIDALKATLSQWEPGQEETEQQQDEEADEAPTTAAGMSASSSTAVEAK